MKNKQNVSSLAFLEFKRNLTNDVSCFWKQRCNQEFAKNWVTEKLNENEKISDKKNFPPFSYYSVTKKDFLDEIDLQSNYLVENLIIALFSTLETYCYLSLQRAIYLDSDSMLRNTKNPISIGISDVLDFIDSKYALSVFMAEKLLRGKTTYEMVEYIAKKFNCGIMKEHPDWFEKLKKYIFIRNSLVHNDRRVSKQLAASFDEFNSKENQVFNLTNENGMELNDCIYKIVREIDQFFNKIVNKSDAEWVIKELYILKGFTNINQYKRIISKLMGVRICQNEVDKYISLVKKGDKNKDFSMYSILLENLEI